MLVVLGLGAALVLGAMLVEELLVELGATLVVVVELGGGGGGGSVLVVEEELLVEVEGALVVELLVLGAVLLVVVLLGGGGGGGSVVLDVLAAVVLGGGYQPPPAEPLALQPSRASVIATARVAARRIEAERRRHARPPPCMTMHCHPTGTRAGA